MNQLYPADVIEIDPDTIRKERRYRVALECLKGLLSNSHVHYNCHGAMVEEAYRLADAFLDWKD